VAPDPASSPGTAPGTPTGTGRRDTRRERAPRAATYTAPRHRDLQTARLAVLDGTVLGEGVVVDARAASFAVRMLSGLIDAFAIYTIATLLIVAASAVGLGAGDRAATVAVLVAVVFALVVLPVGVETLTRGYSLGRYALGIRIVRDDGGPIRFRQALVRGLLGVLELWMTAGGLAVVVTFFNSRGKRLGDIMAGTYALRTRSGGVRLTPLVMPPHLAGWARSADIRPLPDGYALAARQYLARATALDPASRARLGQDLAARLEPFVAPGPPLGTPPDLFLAALLVERRERDYAAAVRAAHHAQARAAQVRRLPWGLPDES